MPALLSYTLDIPFSVSLLVLGLMVLWFPSFFPRLKNISFRIDSRRNGIQQRELLPQSSQQSSSSSSSSRTTDSGDTSSQEDEEESILEAVSTLFYEEQDWNNDEECPRPPNSFVARILPRDRIDFKQLKPRQNNNAGELRQKLNEELFKGATCQPNRTSLCGISFYDCKTTSCEEDEDAEEDSRITLEVDVTAQAPLSPVRYRIQMHLNRPAHESATRTLERLQISLIRKITRQEHLGTNNLPLGAFNNRERRVRKDRKKSKEDSIPVSLWVQDSETTDDVDGDSEEGYRRLMIEDLTNSSSLWQTLSKQTAGSRLCMHLSGTIGRENDVIIPVVACPPTLLSIQTFQDFGAKIFVGVPLVVEIEAIHTSELIVVWFVGDEEAHRGSLLYTPCAADVGKIVSLLLVPIHPHNDGKGYEEAYSFENPVEKLPDLPLIFPLRKSWTKRSNNDKRLRVLTYNLLADLYASRELDQKVMYNHCPAEFLDKKRRMPLLLYELLSFKPDIICLQEVDFSVFSSLLRPALESEEYQGFFSNKASVQPEGCAMFWSLKFFERAKPTKMRSFCLRDLFRDLGPQSNGWTSIRGIVQLLNDHNELACVVKSKVGQVLQAVELRLKKTDSEKPGRILVGNTHLFYHPMADHVRALQTYLVCHQMEGFRKECSDPCPLLLCGDLNSNPLAGAIQLLMQGNLEPDDLDTWKHLHQYEWTMGDEDYLLEHGYIGNRLNTGDPVYQDEAFEDAVECLSVDESNTQPKPPRLTLPSNFPKFGLGYEDIPSFTNYATDFKETLDYILISRPSEKEPFGFASANFAPMPSTDFMKDYIAMPNENMPSDHVSLVCDLDWVKF
jgi:mRNA deadenylase 3'-5' endonuclease subunit Ccr4